MLGERGLERVVEMVDEFDGKFFEFFRDAVCKGNSNEPINQASVEVRGFDVEACRNRIAGQVRRCSIVVFPVRGERRNCAERRRDDCNVLGQIEFGL